MANEIDILYLQFHSELIVCKYHKSYVIDELITLFNTITDIREYLILEHF